MISYTPIPNAEAHTVFTALVDPKKPSFLFESKPISPIYGKSSLIGIDPVLKLSGKGDKFQLEILNARGAFYFDILTKNKTLLALCVNFKKKKNSFTGTIPSIKNEMEEGERSKQKNIAQVIRLVLSEFHTKEADFLGLYGAISYDFVRLFEDLGENLKPSEENDFEFFLFDTFIHFDLIKEKTKIVLFRKDQAEVRKAVKKILKQLDEKKHISSFKIEGGKFLLSREEYKNLVKIAKKQAKKGEIFEVVFSNVLTAKFSGDPFALYLAYRELNPSPYLYYFNFGKEQLVGASPEMMVKVDNKTVHLRPISGTIERAEDPIQNHENLLKLLADKKERSELDMLIDLGRNDLSRVCKPGICLKEYRSVEKYSKVMHTIAHLTGELNDEYTAFDALLACLNAGTLTGAPKVAAMRLIEKHEKARRGFYGGSIGYLTFSGDMNTAIIIRTAHIKNGTLRFQVGATLLYRSDPELEYQETLHKAEAFIRLLTPNYENPRH